MKLTSRLTLVFVLYALALLAGASWLAYDGGRDALRQATESELQSISIEKYAALNEWVEEKRADMATLAASPRILESAMNLFSATPGSPEAQNAYTQFIMEVQPRVDGGEFQGVLLLDPSTGQVMAATDPTEEGKFKENRLFFLNGKNAPYVQNVYYSISLQGPAMTASAPLRSADGILVGVLAGRLDLEELDAIINRRAGTWQTDEAFLVNTSRLFVTQPRLKPDRAVLLRGVHTEAVDRCLERNSGAISSEDYRGIPALIVYRWLPEHELCLIVKIDQAEALSPVFAFGRQVILISAAALLGAIALGMVLSLGIARPIRELQAGVMRFGQGDQNVRLPEKGPDELSDLAREFNRMAVSLAEKDARLHEYATELERKVDERTATLKQREERYRSYIEVTGQIGWTTNPQGEIQEEMHSWRQFTGQSEDEVKGWGWINALHPDDREHVTQAWNQAVATRTTYEVEYRLRRHDGVYRYFLGRGVPNYEDNGEIREWVGTSIDITEREQAAEALRRYELLSENSRDIILFMRREDGHILEANTAALHAYGYSRDELLALTIQDLRAPETQKLTAKQMMQADTQSILFETVHQRKDGSTFPVEVSSQGATIGNLRTLVSIVRDITERKQAEEEVSANRAKLEAALASMSDAVFISDVDGRFIEFNDAFATFHKFATREECAKTLAEYPEFLEVFMANGELAPLNQWAVPRALRGETGANVEYSLRRKDTGETWVGSYSFAPIRDKNDVIVGSVVVGRDITERKQAEEEIKSLSRFPTENPNPVLRAQNDGRLIYANAVSLELLRMWGCEKNGYLPADLKDLIRTSVESGTIQSVDVPCKEKVFSIMLVPIVEGGYVNLYGRDITERKQAEETLRRKEAEIRSLYESMTELFVLHEIIYAASGKACDYRLLECNPAFEKITGIPRNIAIGSLASKVYGIEEAPFLDIYARVAETGEPVEFETEYSPMGKHFRISVFSPEKGLFATIASDITERKRTEEELRQTLNELKHSNAELEQFAYVASHDLQEPLRGIAGLAQLLQQRYQGQLDSRADEYITLIVDGTQRMQTLINDLLAYSRIGRRGEPIQATESEAALRATLENLSAAIYEYGATITHESLPIVEADATQLIQLFQNLIGNAIKFRSQERLPQIHVAAADLGDCWQFSVRDNGIGIESQYYERIFQVFQRLHTRREYKGTGIGLAICKKIIDRHGGRIWVESEPGQGATFFFTLPKGN